MPVRTGLGGFDVLAETRDHAAAAFVDDVNAGQTPYRHGGRTDHTRHPGCVPAAPVGLASEQLVDAFLQIAKNFVQIRRGILLVAPAPRVLLSTARFIPSHVNTPVTIY